VTDNDPPIALDDNASVLGGDSIVIDHLVNDSDPNGDPITTTSASAVNGTVVINGGSLNYIPSPGFCGNDTISYTICDLLGLCSTANVYITVQCAPLAQNDTVTTIEDVSVDINVLSNDSDPNADPLTVTSSSANNGTVMINGNGILTYTPAPGFCGMDTVFYTVCDTTGLCANAIVLVAVTCANDPPNGVDDNALVNADDSVVIDVLDNDNDPNGDPLMLDTAWAQNGLVMTNIAGFVTYVPVSDFCGVDTITYVVCDPDPACDTAFVFVEVTCLPEATGDLIIPQGFSPNGDAWGQYWEVEGLEQFPNNQVRIYNRWGDLVYASSPYNNDWAGQNDQNGAFGNKLPVGTYWYVLELNDNEKTTLSGYVYLNR